MRQKPNQDFHDQAFDAVVDVLNDLEVINSNHPLGNRRGAALAEMTADYL